MKLFLLFLALVIHGSGACAVQTQQDFLCAMHVDSDYEGSGGGAIAEAELAAGPIRGKLFRSQSGFTAQVYRGVPYATQNRFQYAEQMLKFPSKPLDATQPQPICHQFPAVGPIQVGGSAPMVEDCLLLSILAPAAKESGAVNMVGPYPVLMWVHGGAFEIGAANIQGLDGLIDNFVARGIVVVTVQYRLGPLGFMAAAGFPPNVGLYDVNTAVQFVIDNIAAVGGDPSRITLMGQSAGAIIVSLVHSYNPAPRIQGSVILSGPQATDIVTEQQSAMRQLLGYSGCAVSTTNQKDCMQNLDIDELKTAARNIEPIDPHLLPIRFGPVPDGRIVAFNGTTSLLKQRGNIMIGTTSDEWGFFIAIEGKIHETLGTAIDYNWLEKSVAAVINTQESIRKKSLAKKLAMYQYMDSTNFNKSQKNDIYTALSNFVSDIYFNAPAQKEAELTARNPQNNVWLYDFAFYRPSMFTPAFTASYKTDRPPHTADLNFIFATSAIPGLIDKMYQFDDVDCELIEKFTGAIADFVKTGVCECPHVIVSLVYLLLGAWLLASIEAVAEDGAAKTLKQEVDEAMKQFGDDVWEVGSQPGARIEDLDEPFFKYAEQLYKIYQKNPKSAHLLNTDKNSVTETESTGPLSTISKYFFFTSTTLTLIGFGGPLTPTSVAGRLCCIIYILLGLPLIVITLADLGKFCTEAISWLCLLFFKYKFTFSRRVRNWWRSYHDARIKRLNRRDSVFLGQVRIAGGDEEVAEFLWTHLENAQIVEIPFYLVYFLLILYFIFSAMIFCHLESWTLSESLYFTIISVLTIGFGDLTPKTPSNQLITLFMLFVGLVLTSTCLDVLGSYYLDKVHFFGRKKRADPLEWLKEVQQRRIRRMKQEAMKKLFETITALNFMNLTPQKFAELKSLSCQPDMSQLPEEMLQVAQQVASSDESTMSGMEPPPPPIALKATQADSRSFVTTPVETSAEMTESEQAQAYYKRHWFTLTYSAKDRARRSAEVQMVDFINGTEYTVADLKSFTLYEFVLVTSTKYGHSEAAPDFRFWLCVRAGRSVRHTLTHLLPGAAYSACVSANHNSGFAIVSKTVYFRTRDGWVDE